MVQKETKVFLMENATTKIYTYVEEEMCSEIPNGILTEFNITTAPVNITGLATAAEVQYVDASDDYFRKDVLVKYRKDGEDSVVDTAANAVTIATTVLTFATAPAADDADYVIVSYCHTPSSRTDEIINTTPAGGGRPVEYVTVQGGTKVRIEKPQDAKTISLEVLSVDGGFVPYVNGNEVSETDGNDTIKGSVGAQTRGRKAIAIIVNDPESGNKRIELFFNVVGVTDEGTMPSDGSVQESCSFECPPQDYCRITFLEGD